MKIVKTIVRFDEGGFVLCDTVVTARRKLLVPKWIDTPALLATRPARTIEVADRQLQHLEPDRDRVCFRLQRTVPRAVFEGRESAKEELSLKVDLEPAWPPIDDE